MAACVGVLAAGCAERRERIAGVMPADFAVAVTVLAPEGGEGERYIVEADWVLRAAVGRGVNEDVFPPRTRQLTEREMVELWGRVEGTGLEDRESPYVVGRWSNPRGEGAEVEGPVYLVYLVTDGDRRLLALESGVAEAGDVEAARGLAEALAGLAWR